MTDLAVNAAGQLWASSVHNIYQLALPAQLGPVHCASTTQLTATSVTMVGLSFAPAGTIAAAETLLGADSAGDLWVVDTTTGSLTQHGTFGLVPATDGHGHTYANAGKAWELSGDIVLLANGGNPIAYATVRDCPTPPASTGCNATDTLIELDTVALAAAGTQVVTKSLRGQIVKSAACNDAAHISYGSMYGIAAYGASVYGFSRLGLVVSIDTSDATSCMVLSTPADLWAGAAITTLAP
jgi:hypothetical protein